MAKQVVLTEAGLEKLKNELDYLKNVKRKEAAENVGIARSYGDLSENSEYDAAKEAHCKIESHISELEDAIEHAMVISDGAGSDSVRVGVKVSVHDVTEDEDDEFIIVSTFDANPTENKISDQSPIGKALIGAKVGDTVNIDTPDGVIRMKVTKIEKA
ncbi:MAG: transcription elongation factor GreA [Ruminococcus sp.]|nr:transcription elongation factor GreA [Candidatus Apopatosoma intestinale]